MKNYITLLVLFCSVSVSSFSQKVVNEVQLVLKDNKYYFNNTEYTGLVFSKNITQGQYEYSYEIINGIPNGLYKKFLIDNNLSSTNFRDTNLINSLAKNIEVLKLENLKLIEDTLNATKRISEYIKLIGDEKKLNKLSIKYEEGKLNDESLDLHKKYISNTKTLENVKLNIQANVKKIESNQKSIKDESSKPLLKQSISEEYLQINFVKNGFYTSYHTNNLIKSKGEYINNHQNGLWTFYFENGKTMAQGNFKNGDGGNIGTSGISRNGREGKWTFYYNSGNIETEYFYVKGELQGRSVSYYENGNKKDETDWVNDNSSRSVSYYENGNKKDETVWLNDNTNRKVIKYNENGKIKSNATFKNSTLNGLVIIYNDEGIKLSEQYYKDGKQNGLKTTFFQNGFKENELTFVNDKLHGPVKTYYENGKIKFDMNADSLSKSECGCSGIANSYDDKGTLTEKIEVNRNGEVKQLYKQKSQFELNTEKEKNSKHNCSWCGKTFLGLGFEASDGSSLGMGKTCKTSSKMFVTIPELEKYFCSAKCAYDECVH